LAKIALDLEHALARRARDASKAATASRIVASGDGYAVADVLCTCGPGDAAFEERHGAFCIALVVVRLAEHAGLSPYHFLRTFERATGVTPHQYVLRARLRHAAQALADASDKVVDIAFACGFADLSNFNRAFRAEFGVAPRAYRKRWQR